MGREAVEAVPLGRSEEELQLAAGPEQRGEVGGDGRVTAEAAAEQRAPREPDGHEVGDAVQLGRDGLGRSQEEHRVGQTALADRSRDATGRLGHRRGIRVETDGEGLRVRGGRLEDGPTIARAHVDRHPLGAGDDLSELADVHLLEATPDHGSEHGAEDTAARVDQRNRVVRDCPRLRVPGGATDRSWTSRTAGPTAAASPSTIRWAAARSALDNARLPLELIGLPEAEQRERALTWLNRLGLGHFTNAYPHELSGGMRQRVAIARAFAVQPDILLADEAFGHLDEVTAAELRETFLDLARECGSTAVLITHQLEEAIGVGDRIVVFGKSAKLLADIQVAQWPKAQYAMLREVIQATLQSNSPDPRIQAQGLAAG